MKKTRMSNNNEDDSDASSSTAMSQEDNTPGYVDNNDGFVEIRVGPNDYDLRYYHQQANMLSPYRDAVEIRYLRKECSAGAPQVDLFQEPRLDPMNLTGKPLHRNILCMSCLKYGSMFWVYQCGCSFCDDCQPKPTEQDLYTHCPCCGYLANK